MIKRFFAWLKSIYLHPAETAESQPKENIVKLALVSIITSMLANGAAANTVQVTLTDNADAIQPGAVVNFTADNGATVTPTSALTDTNGQITVSLVSSTVGASTLTATAADGTTASIQVYFVAVPAPEPAPLYVSDPNAPADAAATSIPATTVLSPLATMKANFDKVVAFIEHGIEVLGKDAEADLVALKNKFLL
ncbi:MULTISPECIES: Ig-like domain-containing protein [Rahnella]|uniref:Ig-like domain-containing protein n=1 Tax=Rahnella laticis TaxID=2787622 RepID=A0ABS0E5U1_9GAMM|nr:MULTISPECIES: Ig-like domain-containing protein [Rahnella]MBF7978629.1 Ig-like domain-containing protein [Rahnella laticis]MBF7998719.1 Ig-like domain-containing protein [Rahnella sp. LAC-M12]